MDRLLDLTRQAEARHFWFRGFRGFVAPAMAAVADGRQGLRLLDCGCGTGGNLALLAPYGRAVGFDLSEGGLSMARSDGRVVAKADITQSPFLADSVDVVTSFDVLQCVQDDVSAVREMARVVRPGGMVVLTLAALDVLSGDHGEVWGEVRRYTPARARVLVEQAGLRVERVQFMFATLLPLMLAVRAMQRLSRPFRRVRDDSDIRVPLAPINQALSYLVRGEAAVARYVPSPFGSSLLVVARKPG
jgi:ubiquinone/menaquinone biosynthesis C-methylase UbiE